MRKELIETLEIILVDEPSEFLRMYNLFANENNYEWILYNNESNLLFTFSLKKAETIIHEIADGHYSSDDKFYTFDGYGKLKSFNNLLDEVDLEGLADFILQNESALGNSEIEELL